jgi:hypothetical protein
MLEAKKVKEIKDYAKADVKYWVREQQQNEERGKETIEEDKKRYPKGITSYYEEIYRDNESPEKQARLIKQFSYDAEMLKERAEVYHEAFWSSWSWWNNKLIEIKGVMAKYKPIFKEAEEVAKKVNVSDIKDGFPCGMAILYLEAEQKDSDLGKALRLMSNCDSYSAKVCHWSAYKLPIKMPNYGQCMSFDERVCGEVAEWLKSKGIQAGVYSMID